MSAFFNYTIKVTDELIVYNIHAIRHFCWEKRICCESFFLLHERSVFCVATFHLKFPCFSIAVPELYFYRQATPIFNWILPVSNECAQLVTRFKRTVFRADCSLYLGISNHTTQTHTQTHPFIFRYFEYNALNGLELNPQTNNKHNKNPSNNENSCDFPSNPKTRQEKENRIEFDD